MWILVAVPLLFGPGGYPEPVAIYTDDNILFSGKWRCEKTAAAWNSDLEMLKREYYRVFDCWHVTHPLIRGITK